MLTRILSRLRRITPSNRPATKVPARRLNLESLEAREVPAIIYGLAPNNQLLRFDSSAPGLVNPIAVTGVGTNQTLRGIDFRPRTGQLIGSAVVTGSANNSIVTTYSINPLTGAATLIGATAAALPGAGDVASGYDFNPTVDRIRYANTNNENARFNPNNGTLAGNDTDLTFTAPTLGPIIAEAYDRNFDRQNNAGDTNTLGTTLFAIDRDGSRLVLQGGVNGTPSPNGGVITNVGSLGITLSATNDGGFDIAADTGNGGLGTAFAALTTTDNTTRLYTINLTTGAATSLGVISGGTTQIFSIAVVPASQLVVGSGLGANGDVRLLDPVTGAVRTQIVPFAGYQGGVRVATGDVNRDGIPDAIVSATVPGGHVKVFDGATGQQLGGAIGSFFAFTGFTGTVNVAVGDVNHDGFDDVLVVANAGNGHVKAFSGRDGTELASFLAYQGFMGNVTIAAGDFNNDGTAEIVTTAAINGHTKVFNADGTAFTSTTLPNFVNSFFAFSPYLGDVSLAVGDVSGDGIADFVVASGPGVRTNVRVVNGSNGTLVSSFLTPAATYTGGGNVALADANNDGVLDIRVTPNSGTQANVSTFDLLGNTLGTQFSAFAGFQGGATIGGARF